MSANVVYVDTVRLLRKLVTGHKLTSSHLFLGAPVPRVLEEILERLLEGGPCVYCTVRKKHNIFSARNE